jgi:hypothetical protein
MKYVAEANELDYDRDVKLVTIGNSSEFDNYLMNNKNKTKFGVVFCLDKLDFMNISIPCNFEFSSNTLHLYSIYYNVTNSPNGFLSSFALPFPIDPLMTKLKLDLDNAYLDYYAKKNNLPDIPHINATVSTFPLTENRFMQNADIVSSVGAFYFFFPPIICFVVVLLEIIREKDLKLRKSLLIIGLDNKAFWLSWFFTSCFFSLAVSIVLVFTGFLCRFDIFVNAPFVVNVLLFFMFTLSMQFLGYFITTILKSVKSAYTVKLYPLF